MTITMARPTISKNTLIALQDNQRFDTQIKRSKTTYDLTKLFQEAVGKPTDLVEVGRKLVVGR